MTVGTHLRLTLPREVQRLAVGDESGEGDVGHVVVDREGLAVDVHITEAGGVGKLQRHLLGIAAVDRVAGGLRANGAGQQFAGSPGTGFGGGEQ